MDIGHQLSVSNTRFMTSKRNQPESILGMYALCSMCTGVGKGIALIIKRV